jgi:hypothetical protein
MESRTRKDHMEWCKRRAIEYCDAGDTKKAIASLFSDLRKHPETVGTLEIAGHMLVGLGISTKPPEVVRDWIAGFN